jgi:hypothetical protein
MHRAGAEDVRGWVDDPGGPGEADVGDAVFSRGRIADVGRHRNRRVAGGADEVARLTHVVDVAENDAGSALGETRGNGLAGATADPSRQRNASGVGLKVLFGAWAGPCVSAGRSVPTRRPPA